MNDYVSKFFFTLLFSAFLLVNGKAQKPLTVQDQRATTIVKLLQYQLSLDDYTTDSMQHIVSEWFAAQNALNALHLSPDSLYYRQIHTYNYFSERMLKRIVSFQRKKADAMLLKNIRQNRYALPDLNGEVTVQQMPYQEARSVYSQMELTKAQEDSFKKNLQSCYVERQSLYQVVSDSAWVEASCFALRDSFETRSLQFLNPFQQKLFLQLQKGDRLELIAPVVSGSE
jgi:hypothetical protein